jgi:hypothetical protein
VLLLAYEIIFVIDFGLMEALRKSYFVDVGRFQQDGASARTAFAGFSSAVAPSNATFILIRPSIIFCLYESLKTENQINWLELERR